MSWHSFPISFQLFLDSFPVFFFSFIFVETFSPLIPQPPPIVFNHANEESVRRIGSLSFFFLFHLVSLLRLSPLFFFPVFFFLPVLRENSLYARSKATKQCAILFLFFSIFSFFLKLCFFFLFLFLFFSVRHPQC